jgi:omega-amidase
MPKLNISLGQMTIAPGSPRLNVEVMQAMVEEAARRSSHLVIFPEMWSTGFAFDRMDELASPLNGGTFAQVSTIAKQNKICITGSMPEKRGVGVQNSAAFFTPNGQVVGVYRKIHLFGLIGEDRYFKAGQSPLNLELPWGKTGMAICYDLRFPEIFRRYGVEGSKLVLLPSAWPQARLDHWRTLIRARAIENQYFMVGCNCVGEAQTGEGATVFGGHSMIVDPWGEFVLETGTVPGLYTVEIDLDLVEQTRQHIPVFADRRPEYYGLDDAVSKLNL